jgi:TorA maturation chaperone TorD
MADTRTYATSIESPVTRAVGYSLLAHCFAYPDEARAAALQEAVAASESFLAKTPLAPLLGPARQATSAVLLPAYTEIFSLTSSIDCPTYETAYMDSDMILQAQRMARIAGFYKLFGIESPATGFRPDDISVELEFMAFLARKEVYAAEHLGAPRVAQARKAQRLFLSEHLGCWAPALARAIAGRAASAFYLRLGLSLDEWIDTDCGRLGATPVQTALGPSLPAAQAHSHGPEFAGAGQFIGIGDIEEAGQL